MMRINGWACFFLVTLRLVIGWHFFIEGVHKIHTHQVGKTSTNTPWTSEGFFREGYGPAAAWARQSLGLSNRSFEDRVKGVHADELSPFVQRVGELYRLTPAQSRELDEFLMKELIGFHGGFETNKVITSKRDVAWGTVETQSTIAKRIAELESKFSAIDELNNRERPAFNAAVDQSKLSRLKSDAKSIQAELNKLLDYRLDTLKSKYLEQVRQKLTEEQLALGPLPEAATNRRIARLDKITMWSHAILGGLLLVGLFSRLSGAILAAFLLSVSLIAPALPWAPSPPGSTGHYLYINLYTIEMISLLALTVLPTGKWFGVDALFVRRARPAQ